MSDYVTVLAGAGTALAVGAVVVARTWPTSAEPRPAPAPAVRQVLDEASLDELLGPWPEPGGWPSPGEPIRQGWRPCEPCGRNTVSVLHETGWTCGECLRCTAAETTTTSTGDHT